VTTKQRLFARGAALVLLIALSPVLAKTRADCLREYTPQRGQDGKDVIWVPTEDPIVVPMLEMARVTAADKIYDLGTGDGKIAIAAGKRFGATAVGIEYDADLARHAQCLVDAEGVQDRVKVVQGDIFESDFSDATVVTLYLLPALNLRLRPTLLEMPPGTRVVSYSFTMGEWEPDDHVDTADGSGSAYLWIVPADVAGTWTFRSANSADSLDVTLDQTFQKLKGSARGGAAVTGKLDGAKIEFAFTDGAQSTRVTGALDGQRITATVTRDGEPMDYVGTRR